MNTKMFTIRNFSSRLLFVIFCALFFVVLPVQVDRVSAQTPNQTGLSLITSPLPINLVTEPGTTISTDLKVKNAGTQEETLRVSLMKFKAYEETGKPELLDPTPEDDFLNWVSFSEPEFTLGPNEWKTITATFTVPKEASFGYYYAFVFSRVENSEALLPGETAVVGGTAILVLLEARIPNAIRAIDVTEFSVDRRFYEFLPTTFRIKLKNTGNFHLAPRGNIFIDRGDTKNIAILEVNNEKGNILPASSRIFTTQWADGFPVYQDQIEDGKTVLDENGQPEKELFWNWNDASKLRFGKYQAKLLLIYDDGTRDIPIEGEVSFWVVPWRLVGSALVIAVFFFIGLRSTFMNVWKKIFGKQS